MELDPPTGRDPAIPGFAAALAEELATPFTIGKQRYQSAEQYSFGEELGTGRHGPVHLACDASPTQERIFALKEFRLRSRSPFNEEDNDDDVVTTATTDFYVPYDAVREISIHLGLSKAAAGSRAESALVKAFGILQADEPVLYLSLECCTLTLAELIDDGLDFGSAPADCRLMFRQLLCGLRFVHAQGIVHRDVNPSNLLVGSDKVLKIADFGEARFCPPSWSSAEGAMMTARETTIWWRAPELCLGADRYGHAVDVWAAGCVLGEIMLAEPVLQGDSDVQMLDLIARLIGPPTAANLHEIRPPSSMALSEWREREVVAVAEGSMDGGGGGGEGSLRLKFERHGGEVTLNLLRALLRWSPSERLTAAEALDGSGDEENDVGARRASSVAAAAWWKAEFGAK